MINLLPPKEKEVFKKEENWKIVLILSFLIFLFLFCFTLVLLAVNFHIWGQVESQKILLESEEKKLEISEIQKLEKEIKTTNKKFLELDSFYEKRTDLTSHLNKISEILPKESYLFSLSFSPNSSEVILAGFCPNRELLYEFKQNLQAREEFKDVKFPLANWVKPTNIDFTVTFKVKTPLLEELEKTKISPSPPLKQQGEEEEDF